MMTADLDTVLRDLAAGRLDVAQAQAKLTPARKPAKSAPHYVPMDLGPEYRIEVQLIPGECIRFRGRHTYAHGSAVVPEVADMVRAMEAEQDLSLALIIADKLEEMGRRAALEIRRGVEEYERFSRFDRNDAERIKRLEREILGVRYRASDPVYDFANGPHAVAFDRTFKVGDQAEHGSYNLSYYGPIDSITEKSVMIADRHRNGNAKAKRYRFTIEQFVSRHWNWTIEKAHKRNSEWSD